MNLEREGNLKADDEKRHQREVNSKISILDFKYPGKDRLMDVQMNQKTNIRDFPIKPWKMEGLRSLLLV
jgi:hypothetical protein